MSGYKLVFSLLFSLFAVLSCAREDPFQSGRFIDLTHDFSSETIYWPTSEPFQLETVFRGDRKSTRLNSSHIQKSRMPSSA